MKCRDCLHAVMCVEYAKLHGIENIQELLEHEGSDVCKHFMKASDVVEVVRCKACKHWKEAYKNCKYGGCEVYDDCGSYPADWYCADGERRNDVEQG